MACRLVIQWSGRAQVDVAVLADSSAAHEHVGARLERELGGAQVADLLDPTRADIMSLRDPIAWDAEMEGDGAGRRLQDRGEDLLVERAARVVDRKRTLGQLAPSARLVELAIV